MRGLRPLLTPIVLGLLGLAGRFIAGVPGQALLYPLLGVFPGMALAALLTNPRGPRWTLGLAMAPFVSAAAGAGLVLAGVPLATAARGIAVTSVLLWAGLESRRARLLSAETSGQPHGPRADLRVLLGLALAAALLTSLPWLVNPWIRVRSDAWVHAGLVWNIVRHGLPPEDPRLAGLKLNYVWFFNLFIALQTAISGRDPFVFMMLFNAVNLGVCIALVYYLALELWRERAAAAGAALLVPVGLNAGAWLLWPFSLVTALVGSERGWPDVMRHVHDIHWGTCDVLPSLSAPLAYMVNTLDKFTVGTALSYAWLMMLIFLWALVHWIGHGRRMALAWAAVASAGMFFFHGVVGLSVIPVALGVLGLAWLGSLRWRWLPGRGRLVAFAAATLAGTLVALPYARAISSGWSAERTGVPHHFFHVGLWMGWTLATSLAVVTALAWRPLGRLVRERHAAGGVLALFTLAMALFAVAVHLPLDNETKFVFQVFFPLAIFAGPAFPPFLRATLRHLGAPLGALALFLLFLFAPVVQLTSYAMDPARDRAPALVPALGEEALYAWIRAHVEADGFLTDRGGRDLVMVKAQRQLWVGTTSGPDRAAFPARLLAQRRAVEADLYGAGDSLDADARALARLGRPAYVLYRASDDPRAAPWRALEARPELFARVYDAAGFRLYRLRSAR